MVYDEIKILHSYGPDQGLTADSRGCFHPVTHGEHSFTATHGQAEQHYSVLRVSVPCGSANCKGRGNGSVCHCPLTRIVSRDVRPFWSLYMYFIGFPGNNIKSVLHWNPMQNCFNLVKVKGSKIFLENFPLRTCPTDLITCSCFVLKMVFKTRAVCPTATAYSAVHGSQYLFSFHRNLGKRALGKQ